MLDSRIHYTNEQILQYTKIRNCDVCGSLVKPLRDGEYECTHCKKIFLDDFGKVRKYLEEHGRTTARNIAYATGVPMQTVYSLLKNCKIEIIQPSQTYIKCTNCGQNITCGDICPKCGKHYTEKEIKTLEDKIKIGQIGEEPRKISMLKPGKRVYYNSSAVENAERMKTAERIKETMMKNGSDNKFLQDLYEKKTKR